MTDLYYAHWLGLQGCHSNDIGSRSAKLLLRVAAGLCLCRLLTACCSVAGGCSMLNHARKPLQHAGKLRYDCISSPAALRQLSALLCTFRQCSNPCSALHRHVCSLDVTSTARCAANHPNSAVFRRFRCKHCNCRLFCAELAYNRVESSIVVFIDVQTCIWLQWSVHPTRFDKD